MRFSAFRISILLLLLTMIVGACSSPVTTAPDSTPAASAPAVAEITAMPTTPSPSPSATTAPTPTEIATATTEATESPTATADTAEPATETATTDSFSVTATLTDTSIPRVLEDQWYVDSDSNAIPDFLETQLGFNPQADDCPYKQCGLGAESQDLAKRERNMLLMLDSSGSMAGRAGGEGNKLDAAKGALSRYVKATSSFFKMGFLVYGHKGNNSETGKAESCAGIDLLKPIGEVQRESFQSVLDQFQPTGWTPIAAALTKAQEAFAGKENAYNRIIMVSDGLETCGGDPVAVAKQLHESGFNVQVSVIGFDIQNAQEAEQLKRIAEVSGGEYYDAKTAADLDQFLKQHAEAYYKTREAWTCEVQNLLSIPVCNQLVVNKALFYISDLEQKASNEAFAARQTNATLAEQKEKEAQAYKAISDRIYAIHEEREKLSNEAVPRYQELDQQIEELGRQFREVYGSQ